jgi:predicted kinase
MLSHDRRKVILITGPAGSGKSTVAERIARNPGWIHVCEDDYWVEIKKGQRFRQLRTPEEQDIVQPEVVREIARILSDGNNAVLEFILYEAPPRPLIYYRERLQQPGIEMLVKALRPAEDVVMQRKHARGWPMHADESKHTKRQLVCLDSDYIRREWLIDNSRLTVEETYAGYFRDFVE